jgi:hypothetical protein
VLEDASAAVDILVGIEDEDPLPPHAERRAEASTLPAIEDSRRMLERTLRASRNAAAPAIASDLRDAAGVA